MVDAEHALGQVTLEVWELEADRNRQARNAYMRGGPLTDFGQLLGAGSVTEAGWRFAALNRVAARTGQSIGRLERSRLRAAALHATVSAGERQANRQRRQVAARLADLRRAEAARARALAAADGEVVRLARLKTRLEHQVGGAGRGPGAASAGRRPAGRYRPVRARSGGCDLSSLSADERWIIQRESGGSPSANNPRSSAFGLGQLTLTNRIRYLGRDHTTTDCGKQVEAFRAYVARTYGGAADARAFWQRNGWY